MKKVPHYWWDFDWTDPARNWIVVESDSDKHPVLGRFVFIDDATNAIERAEMLVADLKAGRATPKRAALTGY